VCVPVCVAVCVRVLCVCMRRYTSICVRVCVSADRQISKSEWPNRIPKQLADCQDV